MVRAVRLRGDLRHLALSGRDGADRRPLPGLRRPRDGRDARRPDHLARPARDPRSSELWLRPVAGEAAVPLNPHEPPPPGRAPPPLARDPGSGRRRPPPASRARPPPRYPDP